MTTIVWATDPHVAEKAPESRTDDWTTTVLDKIDQVGGVCREHDADASVWGGDMFHIKSPDLNPHRLLIRLTKVLRKYPCRRYSSVGNHDLKWSDMRFLHEAPIEELFASGVFERLYDEHEHVIGSGPKVKLVGIPYHGKSYDHDRFRAPKKGDADYLVCAAHVLASKSGGTMFEREDVIKYADLLDLNPEVDVWCFGHWHENQGVTRIDNDPDSPGKWVVNVGSLTRGSLTLDNLERVPECVVVKFSESKITCTRVPLQVKPAGEVFDVQRRASAESREAVMNSFVDKLEQTLGMDRSADFESAIETLDGIPSVVRERALHYLTQAKGRLGIV